MEVTKRQLSAIISTALVHDVYHSYHTVGPLHASSLSHDKDGRGPPLQEQACKDSVLAPAFQSTKSQGTRYFRLYC